MTTMRRGPRLPLLPERSALALVSGLAIMPLVIGAGLWRDAGAPPPRLTQTEAPSAAMPDWPLRLTIAAR